MLPSPPLPPSAFWKWRIRGFRNEDKDGGRSKVARREENGGKEWTKVRKLKLRRIFAVEQGISNAQACKWGGREVERGRREGGEGGERGCEWGRVGRDR
jgi:hypothetical protein